MGLFASRHRGRPAGKHEHETGGRLLDRGWRYDLEVWFFDTFLVRGKIRELRQKVLELAQLRVGQRLLDVGCGTGTLAIEAARHVGPTGRVTAIDPAPRQIARARSKARRADLDIDFQPGVIETLPFPDKSVDVVTSTLMMHHLPGELKSQGLVEILRVLKPQGRVVVADFDAATSQQHETSKHEHAAAEDLPELLKEAGFVDIHTDKLGFPRHHRGWSGATLVSATRS